MSCCENRRSCLQALVTGAIIVLNADTARAQDIAWEHAVQLSASVQESPAQITLQWPQDSLLTPTRYMIHRKTRGATAWGSGVQLPGETTRFVDTNVVVGNAYEYQVVKTTTTHTGYGYIFSGIRAPLVEERGKVVLIVDNTYAADLSAELNLLQQDMAGDGWIVLRHDVARQDSPARVKSLIQSDYAADTAKVRAVFLFGHIPVVRSGNYNVDGHRTRPMPADGFYGDMDGTWTDNDGDGILDPSTLPSEVELEVGRVDLSGMPGSLTTNGPASFPSERELLRQYLRKDHAFRHAQLSVPRRALIGDRFGNFGNEAFAASGYRTFAAFFGATNISKANADDGAAVAERWISLLGKNPYLWAYGSGGGTYTSMRALGTHAPYDSVETVDLVSQDAEAVFVMMFGSMLCEWQVEDNIMRAVLATPTYGLACSWSGRPHLYYHHMGLGETIGYGIRLSQNNSGLYQNQVNDFLRAVHMALMGDPTLRLHPIAPPKSLIATSTPDGVRLDWTPSIDTVEGYHVYHAASASGPFTRLTTSMLRATNYADAAAPSGDSAYMVRAVKLEESASGSYYNASQGVFATTSFTPAPPATLKITACARDSIGNVRIEWTSVPGRRYRVLGKASMADAKWTDLSGDVAAKAATLSWIDPTTGAARERFYMVSMTN